MPPKILQGSGSRPGKRSPILKGLWVLIALSLWPLWAWADIAGPLVTDGADPMDPGRVSLELTPALFIKQGIFDENGSLRYAPSGDQGYRFLTVFKLAYGLFENAEISALFTYSYNWATVGERSAQGGGPGDILVGGKYRFVENDKQGIRPSISAVAKVKFPTGKYDSLTPDKLGTDQTGNGSYEYILGLNVSKIWENWALHGNLWYDWVAETTIRGIKTKPGNIVYYNFAVEYALNKKWTALLELNGWEQGLTERNGQDVSKSEARSLSMLPGIEWRFSKSFYMVFGVSIPLLGKNTDYEIAPALLIDYSF
jgi:hypothetical protein